MSSFSLPTRRCTKRVYPCSNSAYIMYSTVKLVWSVMVMILNRRKDVTLWDCFGCCFCLEYVCMYLPIYSHDFSRDARGILVTLCHQKGSSQFGWLKRASLKSYYT